MEEINFNFQQNDIWGPSYLGDDTYFGPIKPVQPKRKERGHRSRAYYLLPIADFVKARGRDQKKDGFQIVTKTQQVKKPQRYSHYRKQYHKKKSSAVSKSHDKELLKQSHRMMKMKTQKLRTKRKMSRQHYFKHNKGGTSVDIKTTWEAKLQFMFGQLIKQENDVLNETTLKEYGTIQEFDSKFNKVIASKPVKLSIPAGDRRNYYSTTASEDPILTEYAKLGVGNIYCSAKLLSLLMSCARTDLPWDIIVTKKDGKIFFNKRDKTTRVDIMTVDETSLNPPRASKKSTSDSPFELGKEATLINLKFQQIVNCGKKIEYEPNPFASENDKPASVAFRYRLFELSPDIKVVVRCEVDGFIDETAKVEKKKRYLKEGEVIDENPIKFVTARALNEYKQARGSDFASLLDRSSGRVLISEIKNNSAKICRWVSQAILAGNDIIQLGYVSRSKPKNNRSHKILRVESYPVNSLKKHISLKMRNAWGIFYNIVKQIQELEDGKYILVKLSGENRLQLYRISSKRVGSLLFRYNTEEKAFQFLVLKKQDRDEFLVGAQDKSEREIDTIERLFKSSCDLHKSDIATLKNFRYESTAFDKETNEEKTDVMHLGFLTADTRVSTQNSKVYRNHRWVTWNPPHTEFRETKLIDNVLEYLNQYLRTEKTSLEGLYEQAKQ